MNSTLNRVAASLVGVLMLGLNAPAADYTWNSTTGSNWNDTSATGWNTGGAYPNAQGDTATFSQNITANQTVTLNVGDARVGALTLTDATTANYGWVLSGSNPLTFDSSSGTATVNVNGAGTVDNTHRISAPIVTGNEIDFVVGTSGRLRLSGNNSGATGGMTISGGGSGGYVRFNSAASLGSPGSAVTVEAGNTAVIGFNTLSSTDLARFAGSSGLLTFYSTTPAFPSEPYSPAANINLTGFNEYFRIGAATFPQSGNISTLTGTFTPPSDTFRFGGGGGALVVAPSLADGTGARILEIYGPERVDNSTPSVVALTAANTYTGTTEVRNGVLRLAGTSGSALNTAAFNVRPGAFLQLDAGLNIFGWELESGSVVGNNNNRVGDTTPVNLYGATLNFFSNPDTGTTETIGALNVNSGLGVLDARWKTGSITYDTSSNIYSDRGGSGTGAAVLTAQSLNLNNGAQLWLRGVNVGVAGSSATRVMLNTAPTMVGGGGAAGSTTISILPGVFKTTGLVTSQNSGTQNWVTYDGTVGLRELSVGAGEYYSFGTGDVGTSTDNNALYAQTGAGTTLTISSATTVNSMKFQFEPTSDNMIVGGAATLTLKSGNLMVEGNPPGDGRNLYVNTALDFNGNAGNIFFVTDSFTGYYLNSPMSNTGGNGVNLSAFNTGASQSAANIGGASTYAGDTNINAGYWQTSASERLPDGTALNIRAGAKLTVGSGATETVASLSGAGRLEFGSGTSKMVLGSGPATNGALVVGGGAITGNVAPGDEGTGTLTIGSSTQNVNLVAGENAVFNFELGQPGVAGGLYNDLIVVNGNLTLAGTIVPTFSSSVTWNDTFTLFSYTGTFTDLGLTYSGPLRAEFSASGGILSMTLIPEPASALLLGLAGLALLRRRQQR